jgi:glutamate-5-semialdehyde dehydrogenase
VSGQLSQAKRIVVKIGSALLVDGESGQPARSWLAALADDLAEARRAGQNVLIVSSGAIALGRNALGLSRTMRLEEKQAAAAAGQARLMGAYEEAFARHDITVAQALLTPDDTERRRRWLIDVIVPRGGKSLVARAQDEARVPVFAHLEGICHVYVHADADAAKAVALTLNAKMRRVSVCGAAETLLIDRAAAPTLLPPIAAALMQNGCVLRGDCEARAIVAMESASEEDWRTEYLAPILAVRVIGGIGEAMAHIAAYGSQHTECIVTENRAAAEQFLREVDSAIVLHKASTQFADGGEFGFGGEIGIATGRLHARGPVGAEQLTTFKYVVRGDGQTRS